LKIDELSDDCEAVDIIEDVDTEEIDLVTVVGPNELDSSENASEVMDRLEGVPMMLAESTETGNDDTGVIGGSGVWCTDACVGEGGTVLNLPLVESGMVGRKNDVSKETSRSLSSTSAIDRTEGDG